MLLICLVAMNVTWKPVNSVRGERTGNWFLVRGKSVEQFLVVLTITTNVCQIYRHS